MKNISYFSDLVIVLKDHSAFLADMDNGMLQEMRNALVKQLIQSGEIRGRYLALGLTNIPVKVKENNL